MGGFAGLAPFFYLFGFLAGALAGTLDGSIVGTSLGEFDGKEESLSLDETVDSRLTRQCH